MNTALSKCKVITSGKMDSCIIVVKLDKNIYQLTPISVEGLHDPLIISTPNVHFVLRLKKLFRVPEEWTF